jgi:hypothetical protein
MKYKYAIINTNEFNGLENGVNMFYAQFIYNGQYINKFATSENALTDFPELFKTIEYEIGELEPINFVNTYPNQPEIDQYRLIDVVDLYNETININLFDNLTLGTLQINRPYINGTWTNEDVVFYVNQLNEEAKLK